MSAKVRNAAQSLPIPQAPGAYDQQNEAMFRLAVSQRFTTQYQPTAIPLGATTDATYIATATVSAPRVVVTSNTSGGVKQADNAVATDGARLVGISVTAALTGGELIVRSAGILEDNSLSFDVTKRIFCDTDGRLTQTPPATGWIRCVGSPITPTSMLVDLNMPIYRP